MGTQVLVDGESIQIYLVVIITTSAMIDDADTTTNTTINFITNNRCPRYVISEGEQVS